MEVALPGPGTFSRSVRRESPLPLRPLVEEERSRSNSPNLLLQTKFFGKVKNNSLIQAEPAEVHFSGFELGKKYFSTLQLINISTETMNIHILPTQTNIDSFPAGVSLKIQFCPDEWRYFYDCVRVHCKVKKTRRVIPANGQVDIVVTFTPLQYETTQITFKLLVSQFNTKPFLCTVTGTSNPYVAISQVEKKLNHREAAKASAPASQVGARCKTWPTKVAVKPKKAKEDVSKPQMDILTHGGVAKMMIRDTSKAKSKALEDALSPGSSDFTQSRQMKEALFLKKVAENERRRQERCRQWQVEHVGEDPVCGERRRQVLEEREEAWHQYMVQRGEAEEERQPYFGKQFCQMKEWWSGHNPQFQFYPSINWDFKRRCLELFQQAAFKIVIQCRMNRRLVCLRKLIKEMKEAPAAQECTRISPEKVFVFSHPTFCEDDPLICPPVPVPPSEWTVSTSVPFLKLKVPQHYKLMGYKPVSTFEAFTSYIPTALTRPLRSPPPLEEEPEDGAKDHGSQVDHEEKPEAVKPKLKEISYKFIAPDFQPVQAHPLRIFNPAPGLHAHRPTPKYLECDPEYHLCPQPTYHQQVQNDEPTYTQDHLMDKEVIEEIMTWKKGFDTILLNCLAKHRSQTPHVELPGRYKGYNSS
ncbi:hypothetical protein WMY93_022778 [Mugilogobius chulae]|uniref:Primary ciliary dyskinesia protein 1 n=1 Tax=Mugilogobius chulae TaxID=88201 RepID=A0AAW0N7W5_9GOBI